MRPPGGLSCTVLGVLLLTLAACGGDDDSAPDTGGLSISWGPRLDTSHLSAVSGAEDEFGPEVAGALARAARAVPNGASQSSLVDGDGRTADEMSVQVVRDDEGNLVHEVTDGARLAVLVPFHLPRQGLDLALFTDLIPGIEPDISSYPHEVLGVWAWDVDDGEAGVFWSMSPSIPAFELGAASPVGTATYEGDAVGLHAGGGATTTFLADAEMVADFDSRTVGGTVDGFRSLAGTPLGDLSVTLGNTDFSAQGDPFSGDTSAETASGAVAGGGKWGARWSDGERWAMGGTFGFAAEDASVAVLGAFTASSGAQDGGGNPDDPVATGP
jgi:hypothetical protein